MALAVIYESAEELNDNSNLIIIGKIGDDEEIITRRGDKRVVERLYNVEVSKILSNTSITDLKTDDRIILSILVGFAGSGEEVDYYIADSEYYEIKKEIIYYS